MSAPTPAPYVIPADFQELLATRRATAVDLMLSCDDCGAEIEMPLHTREKGGRT